jgi:predicted metal-dependent phosphoesterase TrpH
MSRSTRGYRTRNKRYRRFKTNEEHVMLSQFSAADLHIHTIHSDGTASVPDVLAYTATHTELCVIAITDHDSITGALEARRLARDFGIEVVIGEEVSTAEGHLLALFIDAVLPPGRPAAETIADIHAQGGLCVAPHPFDRSVPSLGRAGLQERCAGAGHDAWPLDAIEGFNAGIIWPYRSSNLTAQRTARRLGIPLVGGSDAHSLATIGRGYTRFRGTSASDLYRAIQRDDVMWGGAYWSSRDYLHMLCRWLAQPNACGTIRPDHDAGATLRHLPPTNRSTQHTAERQGTPVPPLGDEEYALWT